MAAKRNRGNPAVATSRSGRGSTEKEPCTVRNCGRPGYSRGLCQTHHRQKLTTGKTWDIRPYRPRSPGTIKYAGLRLTLECVEELETRRKARGLSEGAAIAEILEEWNTPRPKQRRKA
jgi:hypothetical protein